MSSKLSFIKFFPNDWTNDEVATCSLAAQGLWLRMMILAHHSKPYGYLVAQGVAIPPEVIAARCGCPLDVYTTLLAELDRAGVPRRTAKGVIYSKRMVKDYLDYKRNAANGLKGFEAKQLRQNKGGGLKPPLKPPLSSGSGSGSENGNGGAGERGSHVDLLAIGAAVRKANQRKDRDA